MSFTIFLQSFENGDVSTFERSIAWNIFGTKAVPIPMSWGLMYDGVPCGELSISDDEFIGGVSVSRPGDPAILDLYRLAQLVPSTINWDGSGASRLVGEGLAHAARRCAQQRRASLLHGSWCATDLQRQRKKRAG